MSTKSVHLVCSAGGAKCFSYIGAIKKLAENDISIASISACSMGSVIGAMICSGMPLAEAENKIKNFPPGFIKKKNKLSGLLSVLKYPFVMYHHIDYEKIINYLFGRDMQLGEMKIPLSIAALDLRQRSLLAYSTATHPDIKLSEVIKIATAIPPLSEPHTLATDNNLILIDAVVASESPVWMAANHRAKLPIVVLKPSFFPSTKKGLKDLGNFLNTMINASAVSHDNFIAANNPRITDVSIDCGKINAFDFNIGPDEIGSLIVQGGLEMGARINDLRESFNYKLQVEEVKTTSSGNNPTQNAIIAANQMLSNYRNEITARDQIFISYSRDDEPWLDKLKTHMAPMIHYGNIKVWFDKKIEAGDEWRPSITKAMQSTRVAVLLVTSNFFDSEFIRNEELKYFLEVKQSESVKVLWVSISSCDYESTPLKELQCVNNPQLPLDKMEPAELNTAFTEICKKIKLAISNQ